MVSIQTVLFPPGIMRIQRKAEQELFILRNWNPVLLLQCAIAV